MCSSKFYVVVVQWRQRNVQKSVVYVQSCCFFFSNKKHIAFLSFSLLLLKLPDVFTGFDSDKLSPGVLDWLLGEYELTGWSSKKHKFTYR